MYIYRLGSRIESDLELVQTRQWSAWFLDCPIDFEVGRKEVGGVLISDYNYSIWQRSILEVK